MGYKWKINDEAMAIMTVHLRDFTQEKKPQLLFKESEKFIVQDVIQLKCDVVLNIGIEFNTNSEVYYYCRKCRKQHVVKKLNDKFILFPEKWFVKTKGEKLYDKIKRKVKKLFKKEEQFEELISKKVERKIPIEVPQKLHEKKRVKEKEVL